MLQELVSCLFQARNTFSPLDSWFIQIVLISYTFVGLMLQKQAPASTIPRFNPHGYQAPPQERKKEDPTSPSKVVKKRAEAVEIVDFSKFNIEDLLLDMVSNHSYSNFKKAR